MSVYDLSSLTHCSVHVMCTFSCSSQDADAARRDDLATIGPSLQLLPCGGYSMSSSPVPLSSVYRAAGPVLYNVTVNASHTSVVTRQTVELVATVHSVSALTMPPLGKYYQLLHYYLLHYYLPPVCF